MTQIQISILMFIYLVHINVHTITYLAFSRLSMFTRAPPCENNDIVMIIYEEREKENSTGSPGCDDRLGSSWGLYLVETEARMLMLPSMYLPFIPLSPPGLWAYNFVIRFVHISRCKSHCLPPASPHGYKPKRQCHWICPRLRPRQTEASLLQMK